MNVLLLRHGEAARHASSDSERPLTERGREQARAIGRRLAESGWRPGRLWVSPYRRARQTAETVASVAGPDWAWETVATITPNGSPHTVIEALTALDENLLLVSHNPLVSSLLAALEGDGPSVDTPVLGTGELAWLEGEVMAAGCMTLKAHWRP